MMLIHLTDFMTRDVRQHLSAAPFEIFSIVTSSGHRLHDCQPDHAAVHPRGSRVVVWCDDQSSVTLSAIHIVAIEKDGSPPQGPA
jgi:hypothetical protein